VRRELEVIAGDLHCTAVRICSADLARLGLPQRGERAVPVHAGHHPGVTVPERIARPDRDSLLRAPATRQLLNEFLARAAAAVRPDFGGKIPCSASDWMLPY
jgi:hypothetical protein